MGSLFSEFFVKFGGVFFGGVWDYSGPYARGNLEVFYEALEVLATTIQTRKKTLKTY